jgi:hypothetical protein
VVFVREPEISLNHSGIEQGTGEKVKKFWDRSGTGEILLEPHWYRTETVKKL